MEQERNEEPLEKPEQAGDAESGRVARLERSVRLLWIAVVVLSLAGGALALRAGMASSRVTVQELAVTDAEGRVRIALSAAASGGSIDHFDAEGRRRISQGIEPDGKASLTLLDSAGARRIGAAAFADGDAGIAVLDRSGKVRIQLISEADGLAGSVLLDPQGRKRIETFAAADGRVLQSFLDPSGDVRLQLGTRPDGSAVSSLISSQPDEEEAAPDEDGG
jgi:hypothetical protein